MTLRVVPGYRRIYRSNTGRVSVNIGKVPRGFGMVPEEKEIFRRSSEWFREVPGKHRNGSGKVGIVPGFDYAMFIN